MRPTWPRIKEVQKRQVAILERMKFSLKWLEVFQAIGRSGSMQEAARLLNISVSTASHHLTCLEQMVGVSLVDHAKRPMRLTPEGETLLRRVDESLNLLRRGVTEVWSKDPGALVRTLRIAATEDLDTHVMPELARHLVKALPSCGLSFLSRPSHDILTLLQSDDIDIGIASTAEYRVTRLGEVPLLRDPYVLVVPPERGDEPADYLHGRTELPFLRYSKRQLMGRRIEAQLRRLRLDIPSPLEFESTAAILRMVADGYGWTITTALNLQFIGGAAMRLNIMRFPDAGFVRQLSAFQAETLPAPVFEVFDGIVRQLMQDMVIDPAVARCPWLEGEFRLLDP